DISALSADQPHTLELQLPTLKEGQLQGVFLEIVELRRRRRGDALTYTSLDRILISYVSVRWTGHLLAISSALSRCSSVRSPSRAISLSIRSSMPCRVSHSAQSSAWTREWRSRTVTPVSGHCFRRAYSAMVMEVQAPSAASNNS